MIRHPSEGFIKYLMTSGNPHAANNDWIQFSLSTLGFPLADSDYLTWLRADVNSRVPPNFQPQNRYHRESMKFLRNEGIWGLHNPDKGAREATVIVTNLRTRPLIETLLLGRMEPKEIAKKVNAKVGEYYTAEGIESYSNYYWNVGLLRVEEWSRLLEQYEITKQNAIAVLQVGASMALHKAGFQQQLESKTILREMLDGIYFDYKEWKTQPLSPAKTKALAALARSAVMVDIQLSQADSALKDALSKFEQFRMRTSNQQIPDIKSVAGAGNYSGSGMKLIEAPKKEDN